MVKRALAQVSFIFRKTQNNKNVKTIKQANTRKQKAIDQTELLYTIFHAHMMYIRIYPVIGSRTWTKGGARCPCY